MSGDGRVARPEDRSSMVDALLDQVSVSDGELTNGSIDHIGLGGVDERGKVTDPLLRPLVNLDRRLTHAHSFW
ncbi:MAG: hypothetical protein ACRD0C_01355 [Acidimicrobiia bacterium]